MVGTIIVTILCVAGIIGGICGVPILLFIGAAVDAVENFLGILSGQQKSLITFIVFGAGGYFIGSLTGQPWWVGISYGLCAEGFFMSFISVIMLFIVNKKE